MSVNPTPQSLVDLWLQHAIVRVASYLDRVGGEGILSDYPFLDPYLESVRSQLPTTTSLLELDQAWGICVRKWTAKSCQGPPTPLTRLLQAGLTDDHVLALMLVALVEIDARFGTVYSVLQPFPDETRLTVGLMDDLLRFNRSGDGVSAWMLAHGLEQLGAIDIQHPEKPRASQTLSVPHLVWDAICGRIAARQHPGLVYRRAEELATLEDLAGLLPHEFLQRLARVPELVDSGLAQGVVLRGMRGSGRLRALGGVARSLGRDLLHVQRPVIQQLPQLCRTAAALALLQNAMPVIDLELTPGEVVSVPTLTGDLGVFGVILNNEGSIVGPQVEGCVTLHVPATAHEARRRQWSLAFGPDLNGTQAVVDAASKNYHLTLGAVERAGRLARAYAALNGHPHIELSDVQEACRTLNQQTLENVATSIHTDIAWEDLIVSAATRKELEDLVLRCRYREAVLPHLGRGFVGTGRGVRALFGGPSGTGKTLAARIVAAELGLDLYRVDLSAVVSKYIGETERNLSRLFARAEEQDIVLLLDEGDSLMTARTDVRNSNDRYANLETNYLLQRLEQYEGILLITTNAANRIDGAFQRRIDVIIEFSAPDAGQRQSLWYLHIPSDHVVSESFIRTVALRCQLTGGQIRNAALHATVRALEAGTSVSDAFLSEAIHREYAKIGAASPLS